MHTLPGRGGGEITGLTEAQINNLPDDYFPAVNGNIMHMGADSAENTDGTFSFEAGGNNGCFSAQVSYGRFKELMARAESIIGPGSNYSMEMLLEYYGQVEMTYEEALEEYEKTIHEDKISRAFARLFCDYMARPLGLYPVFLAVVLWMKDRRSRMSELIHSRQISTVKLIVFRYLALLTAVLAPVVLLSFESLIPLLEYSQAAGIAIDPFAFIEYIAWWLLPTAMTVTAVGAFLTMLTAVPAAILVQLAWWFVDSSITYLSGDTRVYTLMIRHNLLSGAELIREDFAVICMNRGLLALASMLLVGLSVLIYGKKRGGRLGDGCFMQRCFGVFKKRLFAYFQK